MNQNVSPQFKIKTEGTANPKAVVNCGNARFTVLTSRLIRLEWHPLKQFEDRASLNFWYRNLPVPAFSVENKGTGITIKTEHLTLSYSGDDSFNGTNLLIEGNELASSYNFHAWNQGNFGGTYRTLDGANGESFQLDPGLMSKEGWSIVDDTNGIIINEDGWVEPRYPEGDQNASRSIDNYFFGYGKKYRECLVDFSKITGKAPMFPRYVLGNWWSRYYPYTQEQLQGLMQEFKDKKFPISICIVDMDWHIIKNDFHTGWTGYTWNEKYFPDYKKFINWLHENGVKTALNLHPAEGVGAHEIQYEQMAKHMGKDPASKETIPFDIVDPKFTDGYFKYLHNTLEKDGVDFWWMDWQQGTYTKIPGVDPLRWINHLHYYDLARDGKRPFIFSRYSGYGSHRYPIGFSGDTVVTWDSLKIQPYFTATAANVNYGWWSHDIGGHMGGMEEPELYLRWLQWGVMSPIMRLHSSNSKFIHRIPWGHGLDVEHHAREAMQFRMQLIPYIYTMMNRNYREDQPLIVPMYFDYPDCEIAYNVRNQYLFGTELLVAPFIERMDPDINMSRAEVWLPEGKWFNFFNGEMIEGGKTIAQYGHLGDIPVYAKAGAIVPLAPKVEWGGIDNPDELEINIFPGANHTFTLYEDDGESNDYLKEECAETVFVQACSENTLQFAIKPIKGNHSLVPSQREYQLKFKCVDANVSIKVQINGKDAEYEKCYCQKSETLIIKGLTLKPSDALTVELSGKIISARNRCKEKLQDLLATMRMGTWTKDALETFEGNFNGDKDLQDIIDHPSKLWKIASEVKGSQLQAMMEIIKGKRLIDLEE